MSEGPVRPPFRVPINNKYLPMVEEIIRPLLAIELYEDEGEQLIEFIRLKTRLKGSRPVMVQESTAGHSSGRFRDMYRKLGLTPTTHISGDGDALVSRTDISSDGVVEELDTTDAGKVAPSIVRLTSELQTDVVLEGAPPMRRLVIQACNAIEFGSPIHERVQVMVNGIAVPGRFRMIEHDAFAVIEDMIFQWVLGLADNQILYDPDAPEARRAELRKRFIDGSGLKLERFPLKA
jgi:hypothetical protein